MFQAEDGIRDLVRSRGLGDVYKRQLGERQAQRGVLLRHQADALDDLQELGGVERELVLCLLYTSDAADERSSVDLGGRRII